MLTTEWLTKQQVATVLKCTEKTVERITNRGEVEKSNRTQGGRRIVVFNPADVEKIRAAKFPDEKTPFVMPQEQEIAVIDHGIVQDMRQHQPLMEPQQQTMWIGIKEAARITGLPQEYIVKRCQDQAGRSPRYFENEDEFTPRKFATGWKIRRTDMERI